MVFTFAYLFAIIILIAAEFGSSPMLGHNGTRSSQFNGHFSLSWSWQQPGKTVCLFKLLLRTLLTEKIIKIHFFFSWQLLRLNSAGQLGVGERCVNADSQGVKLAVCRLGTVDGPWEYDEVKNNK